MDYGLSQPQLHLLSLECAVLSFYDPSLTTVFHDSIFTLNKIITYFLIVFSYFL